MPGKWTHLRGQLPEIPAEVKYKEQGGSAYQDKVNATKDQIKDRMTKDGAPVNPVALIKELAKQRRMEDRAKELVSQRHLRVEAINQMLVKLYEDEGIENLNVAGAGSVRTQPEPYAHVVNKEEYRLWCLENGFEGQMHLAWGSTNSEVKARLENGEEPPPGVEVYLRDTVVFTKEKK